MTRFASIAAIVLLSFTGLTAGDLAPVVQAKLLKFLVNGSGGSGGSGPQGTLACLNDTLLAELAKIGVTANGDSRLAWASSASEIRQLKEAGKLVICGKVEWLPNGGAIAIVEEGGRPKIYLHVGNIAASGITLSDSVFRIGTKL